VDASGALLDWNPSPDSIVEGLAVTGNTVYAGGQFRSIDNQVMRGFAAFDL
jgi:hypothetical protein